MTTKKSCFLIFLAVFLYLSCVNPSWCDDSFKKEAARYRKEGFDAQLKGDNNIALSLYKKAIQINPSYSICYNDLGVVYERVNLPYDAEKMYKKAIELDPHYVGAYTNLALLYEKNKNFQDAAKMWKRRIELGDPADTWTRKAKEHLENLSRIDKDVYRIYEENETLQLIDQVNENKNKAKVSVQASAQVHYERGKEYYDQGAYLLAIKELNSASTLDPDNKEIDKLLFDAQKRALLSP
jgi:tetratricopeptide (TPR) repeat protein